MLQRRKHVPLLHHQVLPASIVDPVQFSHKSRSVLALHSRRELNVEETKDPRERKCDFSQRQVARDALARA